MADIKVGTTYTFNYPQEFKTLPDHTAHAGQIVTVVAYVPSDADLDPDQDKLWRVRAADGWEGEAFESELE